MAPLALLRSGTNWFRPVRAPAKHRMTTILNATVESLQLPLIAPFAVARRVAYEARNVLFQVHADNGSVGLGLSAPVEYVTGETIDSVVGVLSSVAPALSDLPVDRIEPLLRVANELTENQPAARAALEMALLDLWAKHWRMPLWHYYGGAQQMLTVDLTIPLVEAEVAAESAGEAWNAGFRHLKIKVGDPAGVEADIARLAAVAQALPEATLRVDANQAFTPDGAVAFISEALHVAPRIEMVEQPVPADDVDGLRYVRGRMGGLPLFADESARTLESVAALIRAEAVDGVNVKLMKSGLADAWRIAALCRAHGVKLMIGCMLEADLSLAAGVALAAGTGWFDMIDLDSHRLLAPCSLFTGGFEADGPCLIPNRSEPGWGVEHHAVLRNKLAFDDVYQAELKAPSAAEDEVNV
jgi:L-alanine-DL-glutamate epimerase-like enolase superfamily enzyme